MALRLYPRNTQTGAGTTGTPGSLGSILDLSATQGTSTTLGSGNSTSAVLEVGKKFLLNLSAAQLPIGTSFPVSIDMNAVSAATCGWAVRLEKMSSLGVVTDTGTASAEQTTNGIKSFTLTLSPLLAWAAGDRLVLTILIRRISGTGNRTWTLNLNDADSYVDVNVAATGGSQATNTATAQGAGTKVALGGTGASTTATAQGAGSQLAPGGSSATVTATAQGTALKVASGASSATAHTTVQGSGIKVAIGGSVSGEETEAEPEAEGGGLKIALGGSEPGAQTTTQGDGEVVGGAITGGSESTTTATAQGQGAAVKMGASEAGVLVDVEGDGDITDGGEGGSVAQAQVEPEGAGRTLRLHGSSAQVLVAVQGSGAHLASGGSSAGVNVSLQQAGVRVALGGSEALLLVGVEGEGEYVGLPGIAPSLRGAILPFIRLHASSSGHVLRANVSRPVGMNPSATAPIRLRGGLE